MKRGAKVRGCHMSTTLDCQQIQVVPYSHEINFRDFYFPGLISSRILEYRILGI